MGFGPDATAIDLTDLDAVQEQVRRLVPDAEVVDVHRTTGSRTRSRARRGPCSGPGQLTGSLTELQRPEGRLLLAGSDYANGWAGFIDGAIESGMGAARAVERILGR